MRLTSAIWASALIRRVFSEGGFAAVERRGAEEAGAIFIRIRHRNGSQTLLGPAPQAFFAEEEAGERVFEIRCERQPGGEADALIEREARFDGDLWVIELEVESPQDYLDIRLA